MGLCYSLRPLLFGDPQDTPCAGPEPPAEGAVPALSSAPAPARAPAREAGGDAVGTQLPLGAGGSLACARPKAELKKERRRRSDQQSAEEREAEREARKVSRSIDRMLREQKRDLQQTHRLLLLGANCQQKHQETCWEFTPGSLVSLFIKEPWKEPQSTHSSQDVTEICGAY